MVVEAGPTPVRSYNIGNDGVITGIYADGTKKPLFQIAMATFANPEGLEKIGDTSFREGTNSGTRRSAPPVRSVAATCSAARWRCPTWTSPRSSPT